jgi:hypothetical protein
VSVVRRIAAVALLRIREALRGPLAAFLVIFLLAAAAVALFTPGEPGPDRQRAVDGFVFDVALLVTVLAAAAIGSASFAADRESRREVLLHATPLRPAELVVGTVLGHAACLVVLVLGAAAGFLAVTGWLAGGDEDRAETRVPIRATRLVDEDGRKVTGVMLSRSRLEATYELDLRPDDPAFEAGPAKVWIHVQEFVDDLGGGIPTLYPVRVRVGKRPDLVLNHRTQNPIVIDVAAEDLVRDGPTPITIRRADPAYTLGLTPLGLVAQGPRRSFALNVAKAFLAWLLGLLVIAGAASALGTLVGAPVAVAGALLFVLLGRSLGLFREAAAFVGRASHALAGVGEDALTAVTRVLPDFQKHDLGVQVTTRWDIEGAVLLDLLGSAAAWIAVLAALTFGLLWLRRRG